MTPEQIALVEGPESLASLCLHLRGMSDGQGDQIDADRLSRCADLIESQAAELATLREALSSRLNLWNRAEIQDGYILLWRDGDIIARLSFDMWNAGLEPFHQEAIVGDVLDAFQAREALKGGA